MSAELAPKVQRWVLDCTGQNASNSHVPAPRRMFSNSGHARAPTALLCPRELRATAPAPCGLAISSKPGRSVQGFRDLLDPGQLRARGSGPVCSRWGALVASSRLQTLPAVARKTVPKRWASRPQERSVPGTLARLRCRCRLLLPGAVVCRARKARSNLSHLLRLHAGRVWARSTSRGDGVAGLRSARRPASSPDGTPAAAATRRPCYTTGIVEKSCRFVPGGPGGSPATTSCCSCSCWGRQLHYVACPDQCLQVTCSAMCTCALHSPVCRFPPG